MSCHAEDSFSKPGSVSKLSAGTHVVVCITEVDVTVVVVGFETVDVTVFVDAAAVMVVVFATLIVRVEGLTLRQLHADERDGPGLYEGVRHGGYAVCRLTLLFPGPAVSVTLFVCVLVTIEVTVEVVPRVMVLL